MKIVCPVHSMTDCSPLLNGCSLVNWMHTVAAVVWSEGHSAGAHDCVNAMLFKSIPPTENPYE